MIRAAAQLRLQGLLRRRHAARRAARRRHRAGRSVVIAIDKQEQADRIVELVKAEFPLAKLLVRAFDRGHALRAGQGRRRLPDPRNVRIGADARRAKPLLSLGATDEEVAETIDGVRDRDRQRFNAQIVGGVAGGPRPAAVQRRGAGPREWRGGRANRSRSCSTSRRNRRCRRPRKRPRTDLDGPFIRGLPTAQD